MLHKHYKRIDRHTESEWGRRTTCQSRCSFRLTVILGIVLFPYISETNIYLYLDLYRLYIRYIRRKKLDMVYLTRVSDFSLLLLTLYSCLTLFLLWLA